MTTQSADAGTITRPPLAQPAEIEVTVLKWPQQEDLRWWLANRRLPRILVVDHGVRPPEVVDDLEDWVRGELDPVDRRARCRALSKRAIAAGIQPPTLDADGLLRHDGRWVAIPAGQLGVVQLLLERLNRVVPTTAIVEAYEAAGGSGHPNTIRTAVGRLAQRVRDVGLELVTVRGRGVLLSTAPPEGR